MVQGTARRQVLVKFRKCSVSICISLFADSAACIVILSLTPAAKILFRPMSKRCEMKSSSLGKIWRSPDHQLVLFISAAAPLPCCCRRRWKRCLKQPAVASIWTPRLRSPWKPTRVLTAQVIGVTCAQSASTGFHWGFSPFKTPICEL